MVFTIKQEDPDFIPDEPTAKRIKSSGSPLNTTRFSSQPIPFKSETVEPFLSSETSGFITEPTTDENIFPEATYQTYEEFEQKFNAWKAKYLHPFRVASSETLRTEDGSVSEKFKYRYVVYHCARYGAPRRRGM
uniref:ZSWIM3 N-terminal domain-containing protein n=1 Tax=Caenorhabditis tropicalis TaxID=1561998 RepID=A0A1I7UJR9_9PELO